MEYTLKELAERLGARINGDPDHKISGVSDLEGASENEVSFFANPRYLQHMRQTKAGAVIVGPDCEQHEGQNFLVHEDPNRAFQELVVFFKGGLSCYTGFEGVHSTAVVHPTAILGSDVTIGPYAIIDAGVIIGDRTMVGAHTYVGPKTSIGTDCVIHPNTTIREESVLKDRVYIQPGAVIGCCGFGYRTDEKGVHHKLEQLGNVVIENDVEIGSNSTIDRARFQSTVIGEGSKLGNQIQISHNVQVGKHCLFVGKIGVAGSAQFGNWVVMGGNVAVNGHIKICDGVRIAGFSGVSKSLTKPGDYGGIPVQPLSEHNKNAVLLRSIKRLYDRVHQLEKMAVTA